MKTKIFCFAAIVSGLLLLLSCNSQEQKKEEITEVKPDSSTVNQPDTTSSTDERPSNTNANTVDNIYVVSLTPQFSVEGRDGKDWNTQITFNVIFEGQNVGNFDSPDQACCSSGRPGSPNPTDWNSGDVIPQGIKTLPGYRLNRTDITREMLSNSYAFLNWRPLRGKDGSDGVRWTLTARFSDNSQAVYSRVETFASQSQAQAKRTLLRDNIQ